MDLSACTSGELEQLILGHAAARSGQPFDPNQTPIWQEGFRLWTQVTRPAATMLTISPNATAAAG